MTAALLRRAADLIEQTATDLPDGHLDAWRKPHIRASLIPWVALMDPAIAAPLAAWLRGEAASWDDPGVTTVYPAARALARAILGETL